MSLPFLNGQEMTEHALFQLPADSWSFCIIGLIHHRAQLIYRLLASYRPGDCRVDLYHPLDSEI